MNKHHHIFLGGKDLEMITIAQMLKAHAPNLTIHDKQLAWGASTSDYKEEISQALATPDAIIVCIELIQDIEIPPNRLVIIDHHDKLAGKDKETSIQQLFKLLDLPPNLWTRHYQLVSANDRAHIPGMLDLPNPATKEELITTRHADRQAQGFTPKLEADAKIAINNKKSYCDNQLTVIQLNQNKTAAVMDSLAPELGGPGYTTCIIICPNEVNAYGPGWFIDALNQWADNTSQSLKPWFGGNLPDAGFWGCILNPEGFTEIAEQLYEESQILRELKRAVAEYHLKNPRHTIAWVSMDLAPGYQERVATEKEARRSGAEIWRSKLATNFIFSIQCEILANSHLTQSEIEEQRGKLQIHPIEIKNILSLKKRYEAEEEATKLNCYKNLMEGRIKNNWREKMEDEKYNTGMSMDHPDFIRFYNS